MPLVHSLTKSTIKYCERLEQSTYHPLAITSSCDEQADSCNQTSGSSVSYHDILPQDTSLIEDNMLFSASLDLCIGNGPAKDLSSSSMHKESLEAGGCAFQMTESTPSAAYSTPFSDLGGMLSENVGSSNDLRYLFPSAPKAFF